MDVLPSFISVLDSDAKSSSNSRLQRVKSPGWSEAKWDQVIVENVDLLADCLREARIIAEDSTLLVLGTQADNIDIVLAEVSMTEGQDLRRLVLLEDKLLSNHQAKRQVLAQIVEYSRVVQEEWPRANLIEKLPNHPEWIEQNRSELKIICQRAEFLLLIAGDGINEGLERLARRFAAHENPLTLSELALLSMPLYAQGDRLLLVPHVVSAVQRSTRELTVKVVVEDLEGARLRADVSLAPADADDKPLVRQEVSTFLFDLKSRLDNVLPGFMETSKPRKTLDYIRNCGDGTSIVFRVHFGGYLREAWSPIQCGLTMTTHDTVARDLWIARFRAAQPELPPSTEVATGGPRTVHVLKSFVWSSKADLNEQLAVTLASEFRQFVHVLVPLLALLDGETGTPVAF